jgi:peptide deformylase
MVCGAGKELRRVDPRKPKPYLARMAIRPILILPDPILRKASKPVARIDAKVKTLVSDMFDTMYDAPGIGLAAVQVGELVRVIVADPTRGEEEKKPVAMINPEIVWSSEEKEPYEEGCLSIPEELYEVERPVRIRVRYTDLEGEEHELEADGLFARVIQHEIDHINGVLFIDHLSRLKRERVTKKFAKAAKREAAG